MNYLDAVREATLSSVRSMLPSDKNTTLIRHTITGKNEYGDPVYTKEEFDFASIVVPFDHVQKETDIGYLDTIAAEIVWERCPITPIEGDYIRFDGILYRLNKWTPYNLNGVTAYYGGFLERVQNQESAGA